MSKIITGVTPAPLDDVGAEVAGGFTDMLAFFLTYIVPGVIVLTLAVIGVTMGINWLRRRAR